MISKESRCFSDIRRWITNKLKINNSKTQLIVLISSQLKCDLIDLSLNGGESQITHSQKVRDFRVIFDQFLNFDYHNTTICRSTHFLTLKNCKIVLLLSMHLLDKIIVIPSCTIFL